MNTLNRKLCTYRISQVRLFIVRILSAISIMIILSSNLFFLNFYFFKFFKNYFDNWIIGIAWYCMVVQLDNSEPCQTYLYCPVELRGEDVDSLLLCLHPLPEVNETNKHFPETYTFVGSSALSSDTLPKAWIFTSQDKVVFFCNSCEWKFSAFMSWFHFFFIACQSRTKYFLQSM